MRIVLIILGLFFPFAVFADGSLSLTPPSSDYSVIFLGNLFGIVDGVLHGNGSQLMGKMFGVFNAAVLAIGGIIVTYTLIVGTMNTSHEGQFLGQKWSSIWIPLRSTIGLALLIPKASGYCLMQIFVMWLVVQGVGAADKVWDAALDYLNLGGVIVGAQSNPNATTTSDSGAIQTIVNGAGRILQGEVCMRGLQTLLENTRKAYLDDKDNSPCKDSSTASNPVLAGFCSQPVPDFLSTFDAVANMTNLYVPMPYFNYSAGIYAKLNGVCGTIFWNKLTNPATSGSDTESLDQSRAIAIQQMYQDLTSVAVAMVNNDPQINSDQSGDHRFADWAQNQYGVPLLGSTPGQVCTAPSDDCTQWGADSSSTTPFILNGLELMNAVSDYNGIMAPVLNLKNESDQNQAEGKTKDFISGAKSYGWIMAGTYFFDLAHLNDSAAINPAGVDADSGLLGGDQNPGSSKYKDTLVYQLSSGSATNTLDDAISTLTTIVNCSTKPFSSITNLIVTGDSNGDVVPSTGAIIKQPSATVFGYIQNAAMIHLPGQPGLATPSFSINLNQASSTGIQIPRINFGCGFKVLGICIGGPIANLIYNDVIYQVLGIFMAIFVNIMNMVLQNLLFVPLGTMISIMNQGVQLLSLGNQHPIVSMAYMGTAFINYVIQYYFQMIFMTVFFVFGGGILMLVCMPFIAAISATMFSIGFIDAYYVPFLPYMLFTFGSLAWFMAVIEAMVAGPVVALGITHPEGHEAFGKAEQAFTILINVFLRPALMVLGYVAGIALSYVAVYVLNSGFGHVIQFLLPPGNNSNAGASFSTIQTSGFTNMDNNYYNTPVNAGTPYIGFASMFAAFFAMLTYTIFYLKLVKESFQLIYLLPDNISRWMGGHAESYGKETAQWSEEAKRELEEPTRETKQAANKTAGDFSKKSKSLAPGFSKGGADISGGEK